jgi:hypothetical protein
MEGGRRPLFAGVLQASFQGSKGSVGCVCVSLEEAMIQRLQMETA